LLEGDEEGGAEAPGDQDDEGAPLKLGLLEGDKEGCAEAPGKEDDEGGRSN
jgi:hypothetical protein